MYNPIKRILLNQLAGVPALRRLRDSRNRQSRHYIDPTYNLNLCRHHLGAARKYGSAAPLNQVIAEIGPGGNIGNALILIASGARTVFCIDNYRHVDFQSSLTAFYRALVDDILAAAEKRAFSIAPNRDPERVRLALADAVHFAGGTVEFNPDRIQYLAPCDAGQIPLDDKSLDLLFSHSVLEHVKNPAATCSEFHRILKPGGFVSHVIDLRDHFDFDRLEMLRYPEWLWRLMSSNSHGYVNRCRAVHFEQFFQAAGFSLLEAKPTQVVEDDRLIPQSLYKTFSQLPMEQLRILGLSLVARRIDA